MCTAAEYAGIVSKSTSKSIYLGACGLEDKDISLICTALKANAYIKEVALYQNGLTSGSANEIVGLILANPRIETIDLSGNHIDAEGQAVITAAITNSHREVYVDFDDQSVPLPAANNKENRSLSMSN